jgi:glycosidase
MGFDEVERVVGDMERRYRPDALHVRFLGSHDASRMASRAALDPARDCRWQGGGACDLMPATIRDAEVYRRLERAFTLLYTLPGLPLLYYGDEIALPGGNDPDNRRDMTWDGALEGVAMGVARPSAAQLALRERVAALGRARHRPALQGGDRRVLVAEPDLYVYARTRGDDVALVVLNRGGAVADRRIEGLGARALRALVGQAEVRIDGDALRLNVPAGGAAVLVPVE